MSENIAAPSDNVIKVHIDYYRGTRDVFQKLGCPGVAEKSKRTADLLEALMIERQQHAAATAAAVQAERDAIIRMTRNSAGIGLSGHDMAEGLADAFAARSKNVLPGKDDLAALLAEVEAQGIRKAAAILNKRHNDYHAEHGHQEYDTGAWVYPGDGAEMMQDWEEIEDEILALISVPTAEGKTDG